MEQQNISIMSHGQYPVLSDSWEEWDVVPCDAVALTGDNYRNIETHSKLSCISHGYKQCKYCNKPTKIFSQSFTTNASLKRQIKSMLVGYCAEMTTFIDITITRYPKTNRDRNIQYTITLYKHNCNNGTHIPNNMNNVYYWLFYAYKGTSSIESLRPLIEANYASEITKYMTADELVVTRVNELLCDVKKSTIELIQKHYKLF